MLAGGRIGHRAGRRAFRLFSRLRNAINELFDQFTDGTTTIILGILDGNLVLQYKSESNVTIYDDWFLPSLDELNTMYVNLHLEGVGNFYTIGHEYVSSTEGHSTAYMVESFINGNQYLNNKIDTGDYIRPCRTFTDLVGAYSLRDTGPAGGLIFYIDDTTYYEAAIEDIEHSIWSNITATEIGVTAQGTAIGTGVTNTAAIMAQAGHTTSAAKLCYDYSVTVETQVASDEVIRSWAKYIE